MMAKNNDTPESPDGSPNEEGFQTQRELIVITSSEAAMRATEAGLESLTGADVGGLNEFLVDQGVTVEPLFGVSEDRLEAQADALAEETGTDVPDLSVYYQVKAPDEDLDDLAESLLQLDGVEAAYVKPMTVEAQFDLNSMEPAAESAPTVTPDFTSRQGYLGPAPVGIDAHYAWTVPGGRGAGINIIDIERAWNFTHEDLTHNQGGVISGTNQPNNNHGTAVVGEFSGDVNAFGITGISPDARVSAVSRIPHGTAQAIRIAADHLNAGDIILLEVHRAGPNSGGGSGQFGYIAIEFWPDDFDAIRYAVAKGIIVVEAAGNGGQNLDDPVYNNIPVGFPATWTNPFNPANPSSDAVIVGAGMPPRGTHGRNHHPFWGDVYADRGRCYFSNYGARVDVQGWGWEVTSTGYGDLQGGPDRNQWYTDQFSGTSSASPIVVGALACIQGILREHGRPLLTPTGAINLLRATGSQQEDGPAFTFLQAMAGTGYPQDHPSRLRTQRIGKRPNLRQAIKKVLRVGRRRVPLYRYWNPRRGDHFYTTNWGELRHGRYGWGYERTQCYVEATHVPGSVPLYRYWNPSIADHFYTTNFRELGRGRRGYRFEGVQCYVFPRRVRGSIPLYRYWNPRIGDHFYTTDFTELGRGRRGYRYEGVQCYVFGRPMRSGPPEAEETLLLPDHDDEELDEFDTLAASEEPPQSFSSMEWMDEPADSFTMLEEMDEPADSFTMLDPTEELPESFTYEEGEFDENDSSFRTTMDDQIVSIDETGAIEITLRIEGR